jgi:hypothetical protein
MGAAGIDLKDRVEEDCVQTRVKRIKKRNVWYRAPTENKMQTKDKPDGVIQLNPIPHNSAN